MIVVKTYIYNNNLNMKSVLLFIIKIILHYYNKRKCSSQFFVLVKVILPSSGDRVYCMVNKRLQFPCCSQFRDRGGQPVWKMPTQLLQLFNVYHPTEYIKTILVCFNKRFLVELCLLFTLTERVFSESHLCGNYCICINCTSRVAKS